MNLHEYQAKRLFAEHGVPIPQGDVASTPAEARQITRELDGKVVVKAQVLTGGRGKAGGIKLASSADEAETHAKQILGMDIKGFKVRRVLIDKQAPGIDQEIYLAILIDRGRRLPMIMASAAGGMDIEEVADKTPEKIVTAHIEPQLGVRGYQTTYIASQIGLPRELWRDFHKIVAGLYECFKSNDASLTEINPLVITGEGKLMAVDGKMTIDDNALSRQPRLAEMRDVAEEPEAEREARLTGINFIKLDGNIGCMVNGAGLAMTTMDIIKLFGGDPANFLDIGGGAKADQVATGLRLILSDPNVEAVLINIFGGITRGDEVAKGILQALSVVQTNVPMVVRLAGTNAKEGREILAGAAMETAETLSDAAQKAVAAAAKATKGNQE
ncbi:MAG: ADP-forming succinate--CoA ligase subunit beta [Chloroflexi bacterium]|nr:ADP-forming succinate--CoA ligase subunit beta [Chloroflexota bacterium]MBK6709758.1 ADP-forming succinate--CoA ligase subunit beta [Chloroflexota bacterium]MBK7179894.1 ADP-forming succinate--CoA ligase subunit beta [Chloroflexota bacterium]MBK7918634.1 ADP-forming succinate--CoA ligase subunit beta [Chloroflexota bacterium]MBK8932733.1 ADP-forming succinate--CoA ligase subunit beta [Chloroflexota bacterium]